MSKEGSHMWAFVEHNYVFLTINLHNLGVEGFKLISISFIGINHINIVHLVDNLYYHCTHWKIDWFHMAFHHLHLIKFNLKNCASLDFHPIHLIKTHFIRSKHGKIDQKITLQHKWKMTIKEALLYWILKFYFL
jgi:hypothetical protein